MKQQRERGERARRCLGRDQSKQCGQMKKKMKKSESRPF